MKARISIELPKDVRLTHDVKNKILKSVASRLHVRDACCEEHEELNKSESKKLPTLRHRAPQKAVDDSIKIYKSIMQQMIDEIGAVLE